MPDYSDPIFWIGMILVAIYAYIGGAWLQRRYDANKEKLEKQEQEDLEKSLKDLK